MKIPGHFSAEINIYGLDHHMDRLSDDHRLAKYLADEIRALPQVVHMQPVETNIIIFDLDDAAPLAADIVAGMKADGVLIGAFGPRRIRIVTHLDVDAQAGEDLLVALKKQL